MTVMRELTLKEWTLEEIIKYFKNHPRYVEFLDKFRTKITQWECTADWLRALCEGKLAGSEFNFMDCTINEYSRDCSTINIGLYNRETGKVEITQIYLLFFKVLLSQGMIFEINNSTKDLILDLEKHIDEILGGSKINSCNPLK